MKVKLVNLFISFFLSFISLNAQTNTIGKQSLTNALNLTGNIHGLKESETVYFKMWDVEHNNDILIDSALVKNGKFNFKYMVVDGPRLFRIWFSKHNHGLAVPLDNEIVSITCDKNIDSIVDQSIFKYVRVDGSEIAKQFWYLEYGVNDCWYYSTNKINSEIRKYKDSLLSKDNLAYISGLLKAKDLLNENIGQILHARPIKECIPEFFGDRPIQFRREGIFHGVYNSLGPEIQDSYYGRLMKADMDLCMGQQAPGFSFTTDAGKIISLKEVIKNNKVTILHFWSNGSVDRVKIHDELSNVYRKYKPKGLEVVSVSSDFNLNQWKKVVQSGKIPGYQVFNQKQDSSIAELYKIDPQWTVNILIDQNGKMIRFDADGPALFGYLYQIFGE